MMYVCGSGKHGYSGSRESEVEEAEKYERPIIVEAGMNCEDEHENAIAAVRINNIKVDQQ